MILTCSVWNCQCNELTDFSDRKIILYPYTANKEVQTHWDKINNLFCKQTTKNLFRICEIHFEKRFFTENMELTPNAVPTIFHHPNKRKLEDEFSNAYAKLKNNKGNESDDLTIEELEVLSSDTSVKEVKEKVQSQKLPKAEPTANNSSQMPLLFPTSTRYRLIIEIAKVRTETTSELKSKLNSAMKKTPSQDVNNTQNSPKKSPAKIHQTRKRKNAEISNKTVSNAPNKGKMKPLKDSNKISRCKGPCQLVISADGKSFSCIVCSNSYKKCDKEDIPKKKQNLEKVEVLNEPKKPKPKTPKPNLLKKTVQQNVKNYNVNNSLVLNPQNKQNLQEKNGHLNSSQPVYFEAKLEEIDEDIKNKISHNGYTDPDDENVIYTDVEILEDETNLDEILKLQNESKYGKSFLFNQSQPNNSQNNNEILKLQNESNYGKSFSLNQSQPNNSQNNNNQNLSRCANGCQLVQMFVNDIMVFKCQQCTQVYFPQNNVSAGIIKEDKSEIIENLPCTICQKVFHSANELFSHVNEHLACDICYQSFNTQFEIRSHMVLHTNENPKKPFRCHICDYSVNTKSILQNHIFSVHKIKPTTSIHQCFDCKIVFPKEEELRLHMESKHSVEKSTIPTTDNQSSAVQLTCSFCNMEVPTLRDIHVHAQIHMNPEVKNFKCNICQHVFTTRHLFQDHLREHLARSYGCTKCAKTFINQESLQVHLNSHN